MAPPLHVKWFLRGIIVCKQRFFFLVARSATASTFFRRVSAATLSSLFAFQNRGRVLPQISPLDAMKFFPRNLPSPALSLTQPKPGLVWLHTIGFLIVRL
jgi:hypothetical protein